jgi:hypothetical protein
MDGMLDVAAAEGLSLALISASIAIVAVLLVARRQMQRDHDRIEAAVDASRLFSGLGRDIAFRKSIERRRTTHRRP